ncbi:hypothetical protein PS15m_009615 [Mucor circinelloides]
MSLKVRSSTAAAYRKPSEEWQDFCRENRHRYPVDPQFSLTVGPTELVLAFFKESVLKRTYRKSISMETDVRTQIALRNDENENSELTLLESNTKVLATFCNLTRLSNIRVILRQVQMTYRISM